MNSVGIDISKGRSTIAVMRPFGEVAISPFEVRHTDSELSELARRLKSLNGETRVVMEATGNYHAPVAKQLHDAGLYVSVVNAKLVHGYGNNDLRRVKTDRKDAIKLANYGLDRWLTLPRYIPEENTRLLLKNCYRQYRQVSGGLLLRNLYRSQQEQAAYDALAEQVHQMEKQIAEAGGGALPTEDGVLPQYQALWEKNQDLAGWLSIEGTAIDYPVMHTAQDEEYYLRRAFDRSNSVSGTPFLAAGCFTGCGNYIIYGHNMKDGSMFAALLNYADDTFWEEHPTIRFDTLEETGTYQVLAAFYIDVSLSEDGVAFPFYEYTGLRDEAIFQEYLAQVGDRALYSTGVTAEFGEQLLTLSTCSYNTSDERFVVVAKQVV